MSVLIVKLYSSLIFLIEIIVSLESVGLEVPHHPEMLQDLKWHLDICGQRQRNWNIKINKIRHSKFPTSKKSYLRLLSTQEFLCWNSIGP
jgi:hypothetical protein